MEVRVIKKYLLARNQIFGNGLEYLHIEETRWTADTATAKKWETEEEVIKQLQEHMDTLLEGEFNKSEFKPLLILPIAIYKWVD